MKKGYLIKSITKIDIPVSVEEKTELKTGNYNTFNKLQNLKGAFIVQRIMTCNNITHI